jgi:hypothetical protein
MSKIDERIEARTRTAGARLSIYAALALSTMGLGAVDAANPPSPCPGAAAWNEAHREQLPEAMAARDATRTVTDPDLRKELQERFAADQRARKDYYLAAPHDPAVARRIDQLDAENLDWLKALVRDKGIPPAEQVGENGVKWAWLLVQHADRDPKLQATVLPMFVKRYEAGELPADYLAKLTDRVLIAQGKPQRFGTQFDWLSGKFNPRDAGDLTAIDARRQEIGLMPLADYACMMNAKLKKK